MVQHLSESCPLTAMCIWAKHVTVLGQQGCRPGCRAPVIYTALHVYVLSSISYRITGVQVVHGFTTQVQRLLITSTSSLQSARAAHRATTAGHLVCFSDDLRTTLV
jgi:hypothetical protein